MAYSIEEDAYTTVLIIDTRNKHMILNCWIVDDEPLALSLLESYVQKVPFLKLTGKYSNVLSAMKTSFRKR